MKKLTSAVLVAVLSVVASPAFAVDQSVPVSASVDSVTQFSVTVVPATTDANGNDVLGNPVTPPAMDFGPLVRDGVNALRGGKNFHVFFATNTSGNPYNITNNMSPLSNADGDLLPDAMIAAPVNATSGGDPSDPSQNIPGDALGSAQSALTPNKLIYTSNAAGAGSVVEAVYAISGGNAAGSAPFPGWDPIPPDQPSGSYSSNIVYTMTLI